MIRYFVIIAVSFWKGLCDLVVWPPPPQALKLCKRIARRQLRAQGAYSICVQREMKETARTGQGEQAWCPLYLRPCCVCVHSVKVEKAGGDFVTQKYSSALVLLITSSQLGAEGFFSSHSGTLLFPLPPCPGKPVSTTTMAAVVKDFSELLCYGGVKSRAVGKAQHQQSGCDGFKSQRWRDMWLSWEGRQEITSDRDAGGMVV